MQKKLIADCNMKPEEKYKSSKQSVSSTVKWCIDHAGVAGITQVYINSVHYKLTKNHKFNFIDLGKY